MGRLIAMMLSAAVMIALLTGCSDDNRLTERVAEFEEGCNTLDVEQILDTFDPRVSGKYRMGLDLMEIVSGKSTEELLGSIIGVIPSDVDREEVLSLVTFEVETMDIGEETAEVLTVMEYELMGREYKYHVIFHCVYYIDDWYISYITLG